MRVSRIPEGTLTVLRRCQRPPVAYPHPGRNQNSNRGHPSGMSGYVGNVLQGLRQRIQDDAESAPDAVS
jgi:hypothetical protein